MSSHVWLAADLPLSPLLSFPRYPYLVPSPYETFRLPVYFTDWQARHLRQQFQGSYLTGEKSWTQPISLSQMHGGSTSACTAIVGRFRAGMLYTNCLTGEIVCLGDSQVIVDTRSRNLHRSFGVDGLVCRKKTGLSFGWRAKPDYRISSAAKLTTRLLCRGRQCQWWATHMLRRGLGDLLRC